MKALSNIDLNLNQLLNAKLQILASDPVSPEEGQVWYNSTSHLFKARTNDTTIVLATVADLASFITASSTNTLTNKTFDANGTGNSISNIEIADFAAGVIETTLTGGTSNLVRADAIKAYVDALVQGIDWKDAVRAASTANIASLSGTMSIDGVSLIADDRVLVKDQTDQTANGLYLVKAGAWVRADDCSTGAEIWGAAVYVREGTVNGALSFVNSNTTSPTIGATNITFAQLSGATVPDATTSTKGKVELAETAEVEAKSSTSLVVTPSGLANFPIKKSFDVGGSTSVACVHNLGTRDVSAQIYRTASPYDQILCDIEMTDTNTVTFKFAIAPSAAEYRAVIIG